MECITHIEIEDAHVAHRFSNGKTAGEALAKFLIKFPTVARKPEFRFILSVPDNLRTVFDNYHFDQGEGTTVAKEIMLRREIILPADITVPEGIRIATSVSDDMIPKLLVLLNTNAYWQSHLTLDRLILLVNASRCFVALQGEEVVGFARVLTDGILFASLWDVVVVESCRRRGIGKALMKEVFSDATLGSVKNWVLFTDTAKALYVRFGFVSEEEMSTRTLRHKLRLQDKHPDYMEALIKAVNEGRDFDLDSGQSMSFLFGAKKSRAGLIQFWRPAKAVPPEIPEPPSAAAAAVAAGAGASI